MLERNPKTSKNQFLNVSKALICVKDHLYGYYIVAFLLVAVPWSSVIS